MPSYKTPVLVPSQGTPSECEAHPRSLECDSGQTLPAQSCDSNRVVPIATGIQSVVLHMGPTTSGFICDPVQSQTPKVCFPGAGSDSMGPVDALSLQWDQLEVYAFPPVPLIPQVISKLRDQGCHSMILIAPGWPNMPCFWDLVDLLVHIPFRLPQIPDLVTQPFNGLPHRNLSNLNLHAWLLELLPSRNTGPLMRWQHELKLLREAQPEPCINQSGPFFLNGAIRTMWTSGRPL